MLALLLGVFVSGACGGDSPMAPDPPAQPPGDEAPGATASSPGSDTALIPADAGTWDDLDLVLADPFFADLPTFLSDPAGAGAVSEALAAALVPLAARDATALRTALEALDAQVVAYRAANPLAVEDEVVLDAILMVDGLAVTWIVTGALAVAPSPESPAQDSLAADSSTTENEGE